MSRIRMPHHILTKPLIILIVMSGVQAFFVCRCMAAHHPLLSRYARADGVLHTTKWLTAKTWIDPTNDQHATGDGVHDDWPELQDLVDFAIKTGSSVLLEPGTYRLHRTLEFRQFGRKTTEEGQIPINSVFRFVGIDGPNAEAFIPYGGVCLELVPDSNISSPAVLKIDPISPTTIDIENIGLTGKNVAKPGVTYGLLSEQEPKSKVVLKHVSVSYVKTAFATGCSKAGQTNIPTLVSLNDCCAYSTYTVYENINRRYLFLHFEDCSALIHNGGDFFKIDDKCTGNVVDGLSTSATFENGPKTNIFVDSEQTPIQIYFSSGRIEHCDTVIRFRDGIARSKADVIFDGLEFDGMDTYYVADSLGHHLQIDKDAPLVDGIANDKSGAQFPHDPLASELLLLDNCQFCATYEPPYPMIYIRIGSEHNMRTEFLRCLFRSFRNKIGNNLESLSGNKLDIIQCRSDTTPMIGIETDNRISDIGRR